MDNKISYRLEVEKKLWEKFRDCISLVYFGENLSMGAGMNKLIENFVDENKELVEKVNVLRKSKQKI